jgi:hypothetical protein
MRTDHLHLFAWSCTFIFARLHVFVYVFTSICIHCCNHHQIFTQRVRLYLEGLFIVSFTDSEFQDMTRVESSMVLCSSNRYPTLAFVATMLWSWTLWCHTPAWVCSPAHVAIYRVSSFYFILFLSNWLYILVFSNILTTSTTNDRRRWDEILCVEIEYQYSCQYSKRLDLGVISEKHVLTVGRGCWQSRLGGSVIPRLQHLPPLLRVNNDLSTRGLDDASRAPMCVFFLLFVITFLKSI